MREEKMNKAIILRERLINNTDIKKMVDYLFSNFVDKSIKEHNTILIKPNLMYYWDSSTGETTDPMLVSIIVEKILEIFDNEVKIKIIESDASAMKTKYVFKILEYDKIVSKNVELLNLSKGDNIIKKVPIGKKNIKIKINTILQDNYLINIPKIKIHRNPPGLTCAIKNNFGLISTPYKFQYHKNLPDYIQAINKIVRNDLIIVDGLIMLGKHPKKMGVILGVDNPLTADVVASKICGINPKKDYLLSKFFRDEYSFNKINLLDPNNVFESVCDDFPRTNPKWDKLQWDLLLGLLDLYIKIVGDIKPPVLD
jgi:uncharacterized protein (DUF362 family)